MSGRATRFARIGVVVVRIAIASLLVIAGAAKLYGAWKGAPAERTILADFTGGSGTRMAALGAAELAVGMWLASGRKPAGAALIGLAMFSTFIGVLAVELRRPTPRACGCLAGLLDGATATGSEQIVGELQTAVARNFAAGIGCMGLYFMQGRKSARRGAPAISPPTPVAT